MTALSSALGPHLERIDRASLRGRSALRRRALAAITPAAACRLIGAGKTAADFLEQVNYNGRRLAKLNSPPQEAGRFLRG